MKIFTNELKNQIMLEVTEEAIDAVDGVLIKIEGPNSLTENHLTRAEAHALLKELQELFSTK